MRCVERSLKKIEKTCGGGKMKRSRIPQQKGRQHLKSCVGFYQNKIRLSTNFKKSMGKIVARAMRMEANQELNNLYQNSNSVFYFIRRMIKEGNDVKRGRCLRGSDGQLGFIEEDMAKIWKKHMETIMNDKNEWEHMVKTDGKRGSQ